MFKRKIHDYFKKWSNSDHRKPLIIRGARQVGKTVAIQMFAQTHFKELIYLNLDKEDHLALFQKTLSMPDLIQLIELKMGKKIIPKQTLLFIDEIQNSATAMMQLRYFYEDMPALHVMAAGSLLEVKMKKEGFSFPVGRVEYAYMYPVTFDEFLIANHDEFTHEYIHKLTPHSLIPDEMHNLLIKKYGEYLLVGGMPEAVAQYVETKSLIDNDKIYTSILTGFKDDVFKYATKIKARYIQHVIEHSPQYAGQTVTYEKFGESGFRSREMKEAFDILDKSMLINRIYASSSSDLPIINKLRKSPKLLFLDIGLMNYYLGLRSDILNTHDFNNLAKGRMAEQAVGQALTSLSFSKQMSLSYWCREKKGSVSKVDFILPFQNKVIPIEVKSGKVGHLKSLHNFMTQCPHHLAIRVCANTCALETIKIPNSKNYTLLTIPFYLLHHLPFLLEKT